MQRKDWRCGSSDVYPKIKSLKSRIRSQEFVIVVGVCKACPGMLPTTWLWR